MSIGFIYSCKINNNFWPDIAIKNKPFGDHLRIFLLNHPLTPSVQWSSACSGHGYFQLEERLACKKFPIWSLIKYLKDLEVCPHFSVKFENETKTLFFHYPISCHWSFYAPWKHQTTFCFLTFLGGIKRVHDRKGLILSKFSFFKQFCQFSWSNICRSNLIDMEEKVGIIHYVHKISRKTKISYTLICTRVYIWRT